MESTEDVAVEMKREQRFQARDESRDGEFDVEGQEMRGEGAEKRERAPPTVQAVPELCLNLANISL